jgi:hypothetical protein
MHKNVRSVLLSGGGIPLDQECLNTGELLMRRFFSARSEGKKQQNVEVHVSRDELAALLAIAYSVGKKNGSKS